MSIIDNGITIIDTGMKGTKEAIYAYLKHLGMNHRDVKRTILTNYHPDNSSPPIYPPLIGDA